VRPLAPTASQRALPLYADVLFVLNQVECWFSILTRQALRGASFTFPEQVRKTIDRFVAAYNQIAAPFEWKATTVHASKPTHTYAELCK
jgi:hypothetical protein